MKISANARHPSVAAPAGADEHCNTWQPRPPRSSLLVRGPTFQPPEHCGDLARLDGKRLTSVKLVEINGWDNRMLSKNGRGIVIHSDYILKRGGMSTNDGSRWPNEIRSSILYWDHIVHPVNDGVWVEINPDDNRFLISEGVLSKPCLSVACNDERGIAEALANFYLDLDGAEPGSWCMSESASDAMAFSSKVLPKRGTLIRLYNAVPSPSLECPFEDIIRFKQKRKDEITDLSLELDRLYQNIILSQDSDWAIKSAIREVEIKCRDAIRVSKESKLPFRLSDVTLSVSAPIGAVIGAIGGATFGMPELGAILGGVAPSVTIGLDAALAGRKPQADIFPYRFAASLNSTPL